MICISKHKNLWSVSTPPGIPCLLGSEGSKVGFREKNDTRASTTEGRENVKRQDLGCDSCPVLERRSGNRVGESVAACFGSVSRILFCLLRAFCQQDRLFRDASLRGGVVIWKIEVFGQKELWHCLEDTQERAIELAIRNVNHGQDR